MNLAGNFLWDVENMLSQCEKKGKNTMKLKYFDLYN